MIKVTLRPATFDDCDILLKWRNDPQTRKASHYMDVVSKEDHIKWLTESLKSSKRKVYIAQSGEIPVGTIRSDLIVETYELSWNVAPECRNRGIGKQMVRVLSSSISEPIRAEIKEWNKPSVSIAKSVGMKLISRDSNKVLHYMREALSGLGAAEFDRAYFVAEMSGNHCKDFDLAVETIHMAKKCGADAIKLQAYTPESLTINCNNEHFIVDHDVWGGQNLYELYSKTHTPLEWFPDLKKLAESISLDFFATAFDPNGVDFLDRMGVPVHKISSFELNDMELIKRAAYTMKPVILSTGMASLKEICSAVGWVKETGNRKIILLKCTSSYPSTYSEMNLGVIPQMNSDFEVPIGLSDHSFGYIAPVVAVSKGAKIIEKHFALYHKPCSPDAFFSASPNEFSEMVVKVREAESTMGDKYGATENEEKSKIFRRSLFVVKDMKCGDRFTRDNIRSIRPGNGVSPSEILNVLGKEAKQDLSTGTPLKEEHYCEYLF